VVRDKLGDEHRALDKRDCDKEVRKPVLSLVFELLAHFRVSQAGDGERGLLCHARKIAHDRVDIGVTQVRGFVIAAANHCHCALSSARDCVVVVGEDEREP